MDTEDMAYWCIWVHSATTKLIADLECPSSILLVAKRSSLSAGSPFTILYGKLYEG